MRLTSVALGFCQLPGIAEPWREFFKRIFSVGESTNLTPLLTESKLHTEYLNHPWCFKIRGIKANQKDQNTYTNKPWAILVWRCCFHNYVANKQHLVPKSNHCLTWQKSQQTHTIPRYKRYKHTYETHIHAGSAVFYPVKIDTHTRTLRQHTAKNLPSLTVNSVKNLHYIQLFYYELWQRWTNNIYCLTEYNKPQSDKDVTYVEKK